MRIIARTIWTLIIVALFGATSMTLSQCNSSNPRTPEPQTLLKADREAPLGRVYLTVYLDSTFQFTTTGIRANLTTNYFGKADIKGDTIFFHYIDSIPKAGKTAVFNDKVVAYIEGEYPERLEIKHSTLKYDTAK